MSKRSTVLVRSVVAVLAVVLGAVGFGAPVGAAVPDVWAFAYSDTAMPPLPNWPVDPARQAGTYLSTCPRQEVTVTGLSAGVYDVRFPCSASKYGIVHVTAVNSAGGFCEAGKWRSDGYDEVVTVYCFNAAGLADWSRFSVVFMSSSGLATQSLHAYAFANAAGVLQTGFNSTGGTVASIRTAPGRYRIELGMPTGQSLAGDLQLTAVDSTGAPRHCSVVDWTQTARSYLVYTMCFDELGKAIDTAFTLSYHHKSAVFGAPATASAPVAYLFGPLPISLPDTSFNSAGGTNILWPPFNLSFTQVGTAPRTHMQVSTFSNIPAYCVLPGLPPWLVVAPDVDVDVSCHEPGGRQSPVPYFITYASSP